MELGAAQQAEFLEELWDHYARHGRSDLPWRRPEADGSFDPYKIMVSELMLQQTQVLRVIPKYHAFLERFPTVDVLAEAELGDVLRSWQGLGYNRRAKFLWQAVQQIHELGGFPKTVAELVKLPGIGAGTAGAILAYAFNQPVAYVETNVRTVYIHHFFADQAGVHDKDILSLVEQTVDRENPREFYWALMDYGSYLKSTIGNLNTASKHYTKQSKFHGSKRQVRGQVLRLLGDGALPFEALQAAVPDDRLPVVLLDLQNEGMVRFERGAYLL
jgi:A/G-specific adenine glycosylase